MKRGQINMSEIENTCKDLDSAIADYLAKYEDSNNDSNELLCDLHLHYQGVMMALVEYESSPKLLVINDNGNEVEFILNTHALTTVNRDWIGELVHIIGHSSGNSLVATVVCSDELFNMFSEYKMMSEKLNMINKFYKLSNGQQKNFIQQSKGKIFQDSTTDNKMTRITEIPDLKFKYELFKHTYSPLVQKEVEALFDLIRSSKNYKEKEKAYIKVKYILNISDVYADRREPSYSAIMEELNNSLYKMDEVKRRIAEHLVSNKYTKTRGTALLLVGSPGTGKTTVARAIAESYGIPYDKIDLSAVISAIDLKGLDSSYEGADVGWITKTFYKNMTSEMVVVLDEIDKMGNGDKDGNPYHVLLDTLSDENVFHDAFLEVGIDTSNTVFIATANSTRNLPDFLLNRFDVINLSDYDVDEKIEIAKNYILPEIYDQFSISEEQLVFEEAAIEEIAKNYCSDNGARQLKRNITIIVRSILSGWEIGRYNFKVKVSVGHVRSILETTVDPYDPSVKYARNRSNYSEPVDKEIKEILSLLASRDMQAEEREKHLRRIKYLTTIITEKGSFEFFDRNKYFDSVKGSHYGLVELKQKIARIFNARAIKKDAFSSERILLVGGPGIGKSSICKSIAKGLELPYIKISLNGLADETFLKGVPATYQSADAGVIVKSLYKAGTSRVLIQLDEIDKTGTRKGGNMESILIDLLDDSASFLDLFLGVPLDLTNVLFIATANSYSAISPWIRDRFTTIHMEGYTSADKKSILIDYIIPELEKEYASSGISIEIDEKAVEMILTVYCTSSGVRDIKNAVKTVVESALYDAPLCKDVQINTYNIISSLGVKPLSRGNIPTKIEAGCAKALAVIGDNSGMTFAIESIVEAGESGLEITGLPSDVVIDSVKLAKAFIKHNVIEGQEFGLHLHFGEGAVKKDGPSAGVAIIVSILSAILKTPPIVNAAYTGEIDLFGNIFPVGGELLKIQAAERAGCRMVFVPRDNYESLDKDVLKAFSIDIIPVSNAREVISIVFPHLKDDINTSSMVR